jgi:glycosyltransferase involved in cell wall biosynthesis
VNILIIAPSKIAIPPLGYGGIERFLYELTLQLAKQNNVYLFAAKGSSISCPNVRVIEMEAESKELIEKVKEMACKIDIINLHIPDISILRELSDLDIPVIVTCHFTPNQQTQENLVRYSVLLAQSEVHKKTFSVQRCYHVLQGIDTQSVPFCDKTFPYNTKKNSVIPNLGRPFAVMVSRIDKRKGQLTAIKVCRAAGFPLVIVGSPYYDDADAMDSSFNYFDNLQKNFDQKDVFFIEGDILDDDEKNFIVGLAKFSVFPAGFEDRNWSEPFGRVVAESLAAGTPVIAYAEGGAASELIVDGYNGYLFKTLKEAVSKARAIDFIDRKVCREYAEKHLGVERFAKETLAFFKFVKEKWPSV